MLNGVSVTELSQALRLGDVLSGVYADGTTFAFANDSRDVTLTVTLVPAPSALVLTTLAGLISTRRQRS